MNFKLLSWQEFDKKRGIMYRKGSVVNVMILHQFEEYTDRQLRDELKNAKESYMTARENFEFEEQNMLKEKMAAIRQLLERRRYGVTYKQFDDAM